MHLESSKWNTVCRQKISFFNNQYYKLKCESPSKFQFEAVKNKTCSNKDY